MVHVMEYVVLQKLTTPIALKTSIHVYLINNVFRFSLETCQIVVLLCC